MTHMLQQMIYQSDTCYSTRKNWDKTRSLSKQVPLMEESTIIVIDCYGEWIEKNN
ncbi:hypothetical protein KY285_016211 [Solanum tuberosum]|nr:hypothetical protein KY285_016211 [Solanum tuberosum]